LSLQWTGHTIELSYQQNVVLIVELGCFWNWRSF